MMDEIKNLNITNRLLFEIGRTAQLQVQLERSLREVYLTLVTPGQAIYLVGSLRGVGKIVDDCITMIKKSDIPDRLRNSSLNALSEAKAVDNKRHRLVHDWWNEKESKTDQKEGYVSRKIIKGTLNTYEATEHDLEEILEIPDKIIRVWYRINALNWALHETLPFYRGAGFSSGTLDDSFLIIEDSFTILDNGGVRTK